MICLELPTRPKLSVSNLDLVDIGLLLEKVLFYIKDVMHLRRIDQRCFDDSVHLVARLIA